MDIPTPEVVSEYKRLRKITEPLNHKVVKTLSKDIFYPMSTIDVPVTSIEKWARANGVGALDFRSIGRPFA